MHFFNRSTKYATAKLQGIRTGNSVPRKRFAREMKGRIAAEHRAFQLELGRWNPSLTTSDRVVQGSVESFLVSFCNVRDRKKPCLAVVSSDGSVEWIRSSARVTPLGFTGLARWRDLVCVCVQGGKKNSRFVMLDPERGFARVRGPMGKETPLPGAPHSVCSDGEYLYFADTGVDSIYRAFFDERTRRWDVSRAWTMPGSEGTSDTNHLNGITMVGHDPYISAFRHRGGGAWSEADDCFIYDVRRNRYVIKNLKHPHSLLARDGVLWTCDSREGRLVSEQGEEIRFPSDYLRGLFFDDSYVYAASSKRRQFSASRGVPETFRAYKGTCAIYRRGAGHNERWGEPELVVDLSEERNEIYDLLPLG